jgi:ribonuclease Z
MTLEVTLTGTGVPHSAPGRAGPGTLVRAGGVTLQFDAGRGTVLWLADVGVRVGALDALLVTHVHSDHVSAVADLLLTRWVEGRVTGSGPLDVVCPVGATARFLDRVLDPYDEDIALRIAHVGGEPPVVAATSFVAGPEPVRVWAAPGGAVEVSAVAVHHEPAEAVAYRVDSDDGAVVVSGDTRVCAEVEALCVGVDLLVHEACRRTALAGAVAGTVFETIFSYHADTVEPGAMAERAGVPHLVLTHLIPAPRDPSEAAGFEEDVRAGGYTGRVTVGEDLASFTFGAH